MHNTNTEMQLHRISVVLRTDGAETKFVPGGGSSQLGSNVFIVVSSKGNSVKNSGGWGRRIFRCVQLGLSDALEEVIGRSSALPREMTYEHMY